MEVLVNALHFSTKTASFVEKLAANSHFSMKTGLSVEILRSALHFSTNTPVLVEKCGELNCSGELRRSILHWNGENDTIPALRPTSSEPQRRNIHQTDSYRITRRTQKSYITSHFADFYRMSRRAPRPYTPSRMVWTVSLSQRAISGSRRDAPYISPIRRKIPPSLPQRYGIG